jgi:hypothetical protein
MGQSLWVLVLCLLPALGRAAQVVLTPAADATLIEIVPTNSAGGSVFFNSGTTHIGTRNRALLRFDLASSIPSNAVVTAVNLLLTATRQSVAEPQDSYFGLHLVLRPWGEGTRVAAGGTGAEALSGDATWTHRFAKTTQTWAAPGGAPGQDYTANFSSSALVSMPESGPYPFETTAELVADAQSWLDHPESNFGWMLISELEDVNSTARRFASREDASSPPLLVIDYLPPPVLTGARPLTNQIQFTFLAEAGQTYSVQRATHLPAPSWTTF